ncbi:ExeA family protein [Desulfolithobacter sp.]
MSETHQEALAILRYGVISSKGFLVLTGDVGTGKTTLLQALVASLDTRVHICLLNNPVLEREEFFTYIGHYFGLTFQGNKAAFLLAFTEFLTRCQEHGEKVLLIVDEAHVLPVELLEEIRLLSNQDRQGREVLSIFLVGQPELNIRMADDRLLPLRQRIGMRFHLQPFNARETRQYILFRLRRAGARHLDLFSDEAMELIFNASKGTPRLINIICDHALLTGFAMEKPMIDRVVILECIDELHFPGEETSLPLPVQKKTTSRYRELAGRGLTVLLLLVLGLVMVEAVPLFREYSPLQFVLPPQWRDTIHLFLDRLAGGLHGKGF